MSVKNITGESEEKMKKSLDVMGQSLGSLRGGRATPALVENIRVDYYGTMTPMKQVANVTTPDAKTIVIQPWDASAIKAIEKAIAESDLGINPVVDGKIVRLTMPALTRERREEMVKLVKQKTEGGKQMLRDVRQKHKKLIEDQKGGAGVSEDAIKAGLEKLQQTHDAYVVKLEQLAKDKEVELMQI
jgi:ribosome recycling factor